jgi:pilus assembly protein FimV
VAINKNKIVELAQRLTAKGQFEKAIAEYQKLLKSDPGDIRTWLKVGDLYTRMGVRKEATETYLRVAEQYTKSGFHLKAIAVYKQILKLDPALFDVRRFLANSYMQLGLTSEALIQLEQLVDAYQRTNREDQLVEVLLQMGEIDPQNIATRLRIAEYLSKENRNDEAVKHFALACEELKKQGRIEDFLKVAERLLYHDSSQTDLTLETASLYLDRGKHKQALAKLQVCFVKNPRDLRTLELLAHAFQGLGQPDKAVSVYKEMSLLLVGPKNDLKRKEILETILALDPRNEAALNQMGRISTPEPKPMVSRQEAAIQGMAGVVDLPIPVRRQEGEISQVEEISQIEEISEIEEVSRVEEISEDDSAPSVQLSEEEIERRAAEIIAETDVLIKYGLLERAIDHLNQVFKIDTYNIDARERMKDLLLESGNVNEAISQLFFLVNIFHDSQPEGAVYYLHEILRIDPSNAKARKTLGELGGIMPEELDEASEEQGLGKQREQRDLKVIKEEEQVVIEGKPRKTAAKVFEKRGMKEAPSIPAVLFGSSSSIPNGPDEPEVGNEEIEAEEDMISDLTEDQVYSSIKEDSEVVAAGFDTSFSNLKSPEAPEFDPSKPLIDESSTSVTLKDLSDQIEDNVARSTGDFEEVKFEELSDRFPAAEDASGGEQPDIQDDLDEMAFFMEQGLVGEATQILDDLAAKYPDDPRVADAKRMIEQYDESEDADQEGEDASDGVVSRYQMDEQEEISEDDFSTHYDLGIAYKDMGLFDDAIQEFKIASGDPERTASAKMMIGMCYNCLERNEDAVEVFKEGLACQKLEQKHELGLLYELGVTFQMMGKRKSALACFKKISKIDPEFTDVPARIKALTRSVAASRKHDA